MAFEKIKKLLAVCLAAGVCISLCCMTATAVDGEEIIEEEIMFDENGLPLVDIPDEPIPITQLPADILDEEPSDAEVIPEADVPVEEDVDTEDAPAPDLPKEEPEDVENLPDPDVPLADVPQTDDASAFGLAMSGAGLAGLALTAANAKNRSGRSEEN